MSSVVNARLITFQSIWRISYRFNKPGVALAASSDSVLVSSRTLMEAIEAVVDSFKADTGFELTGAESGILTAGTNSVIVVQYPSK